MTKDARTIDEIDRFKSFFLKDGVLYYNDRVYISKFGEYRLNIMNDCHDIPIAGHPGFQKTYMVVKHDYYWLGMKRDVKGIC